MSEYPVPPIPAEEGFTITPVWTTVITTFDALTEQRKQKQLFAKYDVSIQYPDGVLLADVQTLWDFYMAMKGAYTPFYIYDIESMEHAGLFAGWGDGATTTFDIPAKTTSNHAIYIDGILQSSGYSILTGGGAESSDRVQFSSAPVSGAIITCDFTGYLRMRVRFTEDRLSRQHFINSIFKGMAVELTGLSPEVT